LLATAALTLGAAIAPAHAGDRTMYFTVGGGGNWLSDQSARATEPGSFFAFGTTGDTGFVLKAAVGGRLDNVIDGLRIEIEGSYQQNSVEGNWGSHNGATLRSGHLEFDQTTFAVLANAWWEFDLGSLHPYVGGGAGWAKTELEGKMAQFGPPFATRVIDDSGNGFAWQLGGGVNFDVSPNVVIGVGYRYFSGPDVDVAPAVAINAAAASMDVTSQSVVLDLSFKL